NTWSCDSHALTFFFQADDGIRVFHVTGVQTCALPISSTASDCVATTASSQAPEIARSSGGFSVLMVNAAKIVYVSASHNAPATKIGRASCRERVQMGPGRGRRQKHSALVTEPTRQHGT